MSTKTLTRLGLAMMAGGFLWGSLVTVENVDHVVWSRYAGAFIVTAVGAALLRIVAARSGKADGQVAADMGTIEGSLNALLEAVGKMVADSETGDVFSFCDRIDKECMQSINELVDAREAMVHRHGLSRYAAMMDAFAQGERALNRAWCAAADGYILELQACLKRSHSRLGDALKVVTSSHDSVAE